ncbi:MAG: IMP cyclohydrolase [Clostridia bacterium]|nr:IMP cyclohydrolase [Clostridia bacterium]
MSHVLDLLKDVRENAYPGRGIVLGISADGGSAVAAYFIMGRSDNSRNRVFVQKGDGIVTEAFDPAKMKDPDLIIYQPVRVCSGGVTVVSNGDQTDTIAAFLESGKSFEEAVRTRTFEPDAPNYTPRISGLLTLRDGLVSYKLSILKSCGGDSKSPQRFFFEYPAPRAGEGHFLHTYAADGSPLPSFMGEPKRVAITGDADTFTAALWAGLDKDNKISLFVRFTDIKTGSIQTRILNKYIQ